jgi:DNA-binding transcriptional regulator YdaS (Cro superfamily)
MLLNGLRVAQRGVSYPVNAIAPDIPMNTQWFRHHLSQRKLSQRGLARLMGLDPASVSLMLRGQRRMTMEEAHAIATIISMPVTEVLRAAGVDVLDDVRRVQVMGYVDDQSEVTLFPAGTYDTVVGPADCPANTYGLQVRTPTHPTDGWLMFVSPHHEAPALHLGQLCCVALATGEHLIAFLQRGYRQGLYNLVRASTAVRLDCDVTWAAPVLWLKPA